MARLFIPTGFLASKVSSDLLLFLREELADDIYVLLEFHSGGQDRRQIDVAVLGPYGVDVVEVKNKVGGAVSASINGPWSIKRDDGTSEEIPLNGSARENPYDQANHTADDLRRWLKSELDIHARILPLVLVPKHRADHRLRNRGIVWAANGLENFKSSLRSLRPYQDAPPSLTPDDWQRIVTALELVELPDDANPTPQVTVEAKRTVRRTTRKPSPRKSKTAPVVTTTELLPSPVEAERTVGHATRTLLPENQSNPVLVATTAELPPSPPPPQPDANPEVSQIQALTPRRSARTTTLLSAVIALLLLGFACFALSPKTPAVPLASSVSETVEEDSMVLPSGPSCPTSQPVKGNINDEGEHIFHLEGQRYYGVTNPERCFASAERAVAAGFRASLR